MSTYKDIPAENITVSVSELNQVIDVIGDQISGSNNVQLYTQLGTSGTFQTVYDQSITSITANKIMDITYGQSESSRLTGTYTKDLEPKIQIYRQFAQTLLGSADSVFNVPFLSSSTGSQVTEAVFICIKRLFHRDKIKQNTMYANLVYASGSDVATEPTFAYAATDVNFGRPNITPIQTEVTTLYSGTTGTTTPVGLVFLEQGVIVLDVSRSFNGAQLVDSPDPVDVGYSNYWFEGQRTGNATLKSVLSGSTIDQIVTSIRETRFLTGSVDGAFNIGLEFQNITRVNSVTIAMDIGFEDFNLSSNPTFTDSNGNIRTLNGTDINNPTTFITAFTLHDAAGNTLGVAKPSRPLRNSRETSLRGAARLDV
jgi:hypothetical protein